MNLPARLEKEKNLQFQSQKLNSNNNSQFIRVETPASPLQSLQSSSVSETEDYVDQITIPSSNFHSSVDENEQPIVGHEISPIYNYSPTFNIPTYTSTFFTSPPPLENDFTYETSYFANPFQPEINPLNNYNQTQMSSSIPSYFSTNYDFIDQLGSSNYIKKLQFHRKNKYF
ncbi:13381_t:CDS:1 [Ambispora gerdemannii]|uniref:13381_t:CDS:1 n=1 Tax=Ambispora gerdemannii TaxID=144530 RepID=A0A9N9B250_9GLOM|nr:13381_t:CDS:1 [Ambispora gerdemannii]